MTSQNDHPPQFGPPWTILKVLRWTTQFLTERGSDSARLDAELLLAHGLNLPRIQLYAHFDRPLEADELAAIREMVKRRARGEPIAYIVGARGFWTIDLKTDRRALIPRPDTEVLVESALALLENDSQARLVDVGTGTGAIALAIAAERPQVAIAATDIRPDTLELARENAQALELEERVSFFEGDLLEALDQTWHGVDMVVSNPPYIAEAVRDELMVDVREFEPGEALFAGEDGLDVIRRLVPQAFSVLRSGGHFLCEIGFDQGERVQHIFAQAGFEDVSVRRDYGGNDRVVSGRKP